MKLMFSQDQVMNILAQYATDKGMLDYKLSKPEVMVDIQLATWVQESQTFFELEITDAKDKRSAKSS
jgi:hypothetical protein